jgi:hypothetical protein
MSNLPKPGSQVTLEVRNVSAFAYPQTHLYQGEVVPSPSWLDGEHLSITTGISAFPVRHIPVSHILRIGDNKVQLAPKAKIQTPTAPTSWTVTGSKGNTYIVTRKSNGFSCTCPAANFGRACKHVKEVQNRIAK